MTTHRNPYIVGSVVRDRNFYDRQFLIEELLDEQRACICLLGNRRTGKSSLLTRLAEQTQPGHFHLYFNPQGFAGDLDRLGQALEREIRRKANKTNVLPTFVQSQSPANRNVCDVLMDLMEAAESDNLRVTLLIDEGLELDGEKAEQINAALRCSSLLHVVLAGGKTLCDNRALLDGFQQAFLPPFDDRSAEALIRQERSEDGPVVVEPTVVKEIKNWTGNHPFLIQWLCYQLFQSQEGCLGPLGGKDLKLDIQLERYFQDEYKLYTQDDLLILTHLAAKPCSLGDLRRALPQMAGLEGKVDLLEKLCTLRRDRGYYHLANAFFARWLADRR